ncbi:MAG: hypothetical protein IK055_09755 [Lachnospiraceae bacterium]|nr:hypothetical protein [Lachnospiraceae bacterium]
METNKDKIFRARRAAVILLIIGSLCLCLDFRFRTQVAYPDYQFAEHYGANTQRMILEDVVGRRLTLDFASEFLGYLCLFASLLVVHSYAKPEIPMKQEIRKLASRFGWLMPRVNLKYILIPLCGALLYATAKLLPFITNGIWLYGPEYFINFGLAIVTAASLLFSVLCFLRETDRFQNHKETQLVYLFLILTILSGVLKDLAAFYGVSGVEVAYMIVNAAFVVAMCAVLIHYVHIEELVERQAENEPPEEGEEIPKPADDIVYFKK